MFQKVAGYQEMEKFACKTYLCGSAFSLVERKN